MREKKFFDRMEIYTDWFESEELAKQFKKGKITYIHHYEAYYKCSVNSTLRRFSRREIVEVDEAKGYIPYKGVYMDHQINYEPYWAR